MTSQWMISQRLKPYTQRQLLTYPPQLQTCPPRLRVQHQLQLQRVGCPPTSRA